jgi:hypothetical protein
LVQLQILPGGIKGADPNSVDDSAWKDAKDGALIDAKSVKVNLDKLDTGKNYMFRICTKNAAGQSKWVNLGPICCASAVEDPKINLPRALQRKLKVKVGEKLHINVPFQGKPKPKVTWNKDGAELEKHITIRNAADSSILYVRSTERFDSGIYNVTVTVGDQECTAPIDVAIVDVPSKPQKLKIVEVIGNSVQLEWEAPVDDGNTEILGYSVEKRAKRSGADGEWYVIYDKIRQTRCNCADLILGNEYQFRIKAINEVGAGEGNFTKEYADIPKEKTVYKKPVWADMDFSTKPEFTSGLNSRKIMVGYTGTLTCSLKGAPRPKIRWFKNKQEIIDNPKYKISWGQGIVQLEIRRARLGDAGCYTCVAANDLGEATTAATVEIKEAREATK